MISQEYFYDVFEVTDKKTAQNKFLAKVFYDNFNDYSADKKAEITKTIAMIIKAKHPSILRSIDFNEYGFDKEYRPTLITEYNSNIPLKNIISQGSKRPQWNATKKLINIYGIASGMSYLHSKNILHLNLNPENIIVDDSSFYPKIKDFGINGKIKSLKTLIRLNDFSHYLAPEVFLNNEYNEYSEVYSFA